MTELQGIARFKFHEGRAEEFKRLSQQCMDVVRAKDTGTLQYDIFWLFAVEGVGVRLVWVI